MAHSKSIAEYREVRRQHLNDCCLVTKAVFPEAKDIVGIATETDPEYIGRSEDSVYLDAREWTDEMDKGARELQKELGILTKPKRFHKHVKEFPDLIQPVNKLKNPRNKPCPCGSGKKYKHCCLGKVI